MLDTNVAIDLRDRHVETITRLEQLGSELLLSVVSHVELEGGVYREPSRMSVRRHRLDIMLRTLSVLPFDAAAADAYRRIVETAGYSRRKVLDRMIAAQALAHRATLITRNAADFRDVPGLHLLEW